MPEKFSPLGTVFLPFPTEGSHSRHVVFSTMTRRIASRRAFRIAGHARCIVGFSPLPANDFRSGQANPSVERRTGLMHGVSRVGTYQYLLQLRQSQRPTGNANPSAFQSAIQGQLQGTESTTEENLPAFLVSLFRNAGGTGSTSPSTGTISASQQGTVGEAMSENDADGEGLVNEAGVNGTLSGQHRRHYDGTGATARAGSSVLTESLFGQRDSDGDGTTTQSESATSQGGSTTSQPVTTGVSSFLQEAISKYMLLSPAGGAVAGLGTVLAIA